MLTIDSVTGTNFAYHRVPLTRWLDDMVALERRELELWGIAQHVDLLELTVPAVRKLKGELDARGLRVACVTPEQIMYPVNFASADPAIIARTQRMFTNAAELCAELGGDLVFLTPGWGWEGEPVQDAQRRAAAQLHDIAEHAAGLGLRCVLEALQRHESNLGVGIEQLGAVLDAADAPALGVALDTVAMATSGEGIDDYFSRFGDRVWHVHLVDGSPGGHRAWGDGELPLVDYLTALRAVGYEGLLTPELFGTPYVYDPTAAHAANLASIRQAFERVDAGIAGIR
ncbi:protein FrlC [Agrococcus baldri]|uniref:Protein FrlC n=1 Tax=Agrococcus baldri TaxID=153730 RepID=A0AA94HKH2_9MICO|nr:sugar phosphate isomerase/epimerase family protein [Agrococcus baldri]SFS00119.1 protein FrlC [Agrococcus baldri]